jgi:hypothetical protein
LLQGLLLVQAGLLCSADQLSLLSLFKSQQLLPALFQLSFNRCLTRSPGSLQGLLPLRCRLLGLCLCCRCHILLALLLHAGLGGGFTCSSLCFLLGFLPFASLACWLLRTASASCCCRGTGGSLICGITRRSCSRSCGSGLLLLLLLGRGSCCFLLCLLFSC